MTETMEGRWVEAGTVDELKPGTPKIIEAGNTRIALFKIEGPGGGIYAIEDVCTHDDGPVAEGPVEDSVIECPRHGARFDIKTGAVLSMPAVTPIRTFPVRVKGSKIEVEVVPSF